MFKVGMGGIVSLWIAVSVFLLMQSGSQNSTSYPVCIYSEALLIQWWQYQSNIAQYFAEQKKSGHSRGHCEPFTRANQSHAPYTFHYTSIVLDTGHLQPTSLSNIRQWKLGPQGVYCQVLRMILDFMFYINFNRIFIFYVSKCLCNVAIYFSARKFESHVIGCYSDCNLYKAWIQGLFHYAHQIFIRSILEVCFIVHQVTISQRLLYVHV